MANWTLETHDLDRLGFTNLSALYGALGARPIPGLSERGGALSLSWPDRAWLAEGAAPDPEELSLIEAARAGQDLRLPLWQPPTPEQAAALAEAGYAVTTTQVAMSLRLDPEQRWPPSPDVARVEEPELLTWSAALSTAFGYLFDPAAARRLQADPRAELHAARREGELAGTAVLFVTDEVAGIHWVGVVPAHRRRGVARRLMHALLERARARGCRWVTLQASAAGLPLYESLGFVAGATVRTYRRLARRSS